ncbi:ankyrin repeat domain-containing protein [Haliscomenobacter sp.]|uniref:ankyrin repeat domain-containing protein n=1 Tax=Haliscomenobacter sp. TaxID=2717303 RepID=UPI003BAC1491
MEDFVIKDPLFREAVEAIDQGKLETLQGLLAEHPELVGMRLDSPTEGYFQLPYLLWFVADNPIRHGKLSANIVAICALIINKIKGQNLDTLQVQLDYTLGLVVTGSTPRKSGVQIELMDLLIDEGANIGLGHGALAHGNRAATQRLLERGAQLTLTTAICLDRWDDVPKLMQTASTTKAEVALVAAAFFGNVRALAYLLDQGVNPNAYPDPDEGFHSHATALHQAVWSSSLEAVKVLVEAGARLDLKDKIYEGTPLGWAQYSLTTEEFEDPTMREKYTAIAEYLQQQAG